MCIKKGKYKPLQKKKKKEISIINNVVKIIFNKIQR